MMVSTRRSTLLVTLAIVFSVAGAAVAQRRFFYGWDETVKNIPYDGRFTFVRIRYTLCLGGFGGYARGSHTGAIC